MATVQEDRHAAAVKRRMDLTERLVNRGVPVAVAVDIVQSAWWAGWNDGYTVCQESRNRS